LLAALALPLLSPIFASIAFAIWWEDGGPVFYRQTRAGRNFQPFGLWKFRSMIPDADRTGSLTLANDSRCTRVGKFLRRSKLDELPQLLNVLKGDMRLVGARPELARYVEMFPAEYSLLLRDAPGITDPASVRFFNEDQFLRGEHQYTSEILPRKLQLSLEYQARRTLFRDLCVLGQTMVRAAK
jgi:lipopolysaccharide/colanic/teichoic acid biosynthesis glycosyltransferase